MASTLRSIAMAGLALAAPVALASCGGDGNGGGNGTDPETTGTISVTVRVDGSGQGGITVNLYASGAGSPTTTASTSGSGQATFQNVEEGSWDVEVVPSSTFELDAGEDARKSATVTAGQTANVTFDLVDTFEGEEVSAVDFSFNPSSLSISVGESVRWTNDANQAHNVTADGHSEWSGGTLGSSGATFVHTFNTPGTYDYECTLHPAQMTGTITVNP